MTNKKTNEKLKETFIKELAEFITDYYRRSEGYYYPSFIEFIENIMYDTYLNDLQEENPDTDIDLEEAEENYKMNMEDFEFYIEEYFETCEGWKEIVEEVGETAIDRFLKENDHFGIKYDADDDDDKLYYYEPVSIQKHIQLRFKHPRHSLETKKYTLRHQFSNGGAYECLMSGDIYKYFRELNITDEKTFVDLFDGVYYDLVEGGWLYRKTVVKF